MRKGKIACNKQFLLFSKCFLPYMALIYHFKCILKCRLQIFNLDQSKILSSGHGLISVSSFSSYIYLILLLTGYQTTPAF